MIKSKLFRVKPSGEKMGPPIMLRMTEEDKAAIVHAAQVHQLSVSEFIRRRALGRRASVKFETEIVLQLSACVRAIRELHGAMVERGLAPPEEHMGAVLDSALDAMLRIEGKNVVRIFGE